MMGFAVAVVLALGMTVIGCDTGGGGGRVDARLIGRWELRASGTGVLLGVGHEFTSNSIISSTTGQEVAIFTQGDGIYFQANGNRFATYSIAGNILSWRTGAGTSEFQRVQRFSWE